MDTKGLYIAIIMMLVSMAGFAQGRMGEVDSMRMEKYRVEIGLDLTVRDFDCKSIDAKVMGTRLAGILDYMMENYRQAVYNRKICLILKEQFEPLENQEFELKKIQFARATKKGDEIILFFNAWLDKNVANVKRTELVLHFKNGVSESLATNELFSMMSRYVQNCRA